MRSLLVIALLMAGCATPKPSVPLPLIPPPEPVQQSALQAVWEKEVAEDLAIYKAIRPSLSGPASALNLYDSATQGLASLSGEPTAKAVDQFKALVAKPDEKVFASLRAEKVALDKKTDELEAKVEAEKQARLRAEAAAIQARKDKAEADRQASLTQSASKLTEYGTYAIGLGVLALLFGHLLGIQKWVAGLTIGAGVLVAATARPLIDFFGGDKSEWVLLGTLAFLALDLSVILGVKSWRMFRPTTDEQPPPQV